MSTAARADETRRNSQAIGQRVASWLVRWSTVVALGAICALFGLRSPGFLTMDNFADLLTQIAPLALIAAGLTACVVASEMDVSLSSVATLAGVCAALTMKNGHTAYVAFLTTLAVGLAAGGANGFMVSVLRVPSLIATLATAVVMDGMSLLSSHGFRIYQGMRPEYVFMGTGRVLGISSPVVLSAVWVAVVWVFLSRTVWGKRLYAVGMNPVAAQLSGIQPARYKVLGLMFSAVGAALASVVVVARIGAAEPFSPFALVLDAFAAISLGATVQLEGRPHMLGTVVGVLALGVLGSGLTMLGVPFFLQNILKGLLILCAVAGNTVIQMRRV